MVYIEHIRKKDRLCRPRKLVLQSPWIPTERKHKLLAEHPPPKYVKLQSLIGRNIFQYSLKRTAPAYRMSGRIEKKLTYTTPSPAEYDTTGLCCRGKFSCVTPTLKGLQESKYKPETPGPERYKYIKAFNKSHKTIPKYSFGYKREIVKNELIPGPDVFTLPSIIGGPFSSAPLYSMSGRYKPFPEFDVPAPTTYTPITDACKKSLPKYTLRGRCHQIDPLRQIPGPAAYCPQKYNAHKSAPEITFAIKHSPYIGIQEPHLQPICIDSIRGPQKYY